MVNMVALYIIIYIIIYICGICVCVSGSMPKTLDPTRGPLGVPAGVAARHCFCDLNRSDRAGKSWQSNHYGITMVGILIAAIADDSHEMSWNVMKCHEMSWNVMKCHEMSWNVVKRMINHAKQYFHDIETSCFITEPSHNHHGNHHRTPFQQEKRATHDFDGCLKGWSMRFQSADVLCICSQSWRCSCPFGNCNPHMKKQGGSSTVADFLSHPLSFSAWTSSKSPSWPCEKRGHSPSLEQAMCHPFEDMHQISMYVYIYYIIIYIYNCVYNIYIYIYIDWLDHSKDRADAFNGGGTLNWHRDHACFGDPKFAQRVLRHGYLHGYLLCSSWIIP